MTALFCAESDYSPGSWVKKQVCGGFFVGKKSWVESEGYAELGYWNVKFGKCLASKIDIYTRIAGNVVGDPALWKFFYFAFVVLWQMSTFGYMHRKVYRFSGEVVGRDDTLCGREAGYNFIADVFVVRNKSHC